MGAGDPAHARPETGIVFTRARDPTIKAKLRQPEHAAAVLAWAVAGCLAYQREGLGTCSAVEVSTSACRLENDHLAEYLDDCCVIDPTGRVTRAELRESYERWGKETGRRKLLTAKEIAGRLRDKGCHDVKVRGALYWEGIRLRDASDPEQGAAEPQGAAGGTSHREVPSEISYEEGLGNAAPCCPLGTKPPTSGGSRCSYEGRFSSEAAAADPEALQVGDRRRQARFERPEAS